ncbi:MAG: 2-oxoacid:acceptor oxidoreductase subunit alpha [Clostridia bacterium]|nr:2-oxoacid:acceptor oxidoreductase subunit alpha [Clostridia bacterium]
MDYNILIGGSAGQGMDTLAAILERVLKRKGFQIFTVRDYMSRVRGGHNFIQVRFGNEELTSHRKSVDGIIALNDETIRLHMEDLSENGFVICDEEISFADERVIRLPLKTEAKASGNVKAMGSTALGTVLKLFDLDMSCVEDVLKLIFARQDIATQNMGALKRGFELLDSRYSIEPADSDGSILISGNEAIALGALAAGCKFYSAYPMTPSTSIMNYLATKMAEAEVVVEQAEDEISAINMAIGASYAGARSMTGTSGGGFALMVEGLGLSAMLEVPLVIAEIQRPSPTTGFPTRTEQADLKFVINASQGEFPRMVIAPRNPEDAFYQTVRAFNLADNYQIPVILLGDQYLADSTTTTRPFDFDRVKIERYLSNDDFAGDREYKRYELTPDGISPRIIPGKVPGKTVLVDSDEHDEWGHITESAEVRKAMNDKRMRKLEYLKKELQEPDFLGDGDFETLFVAWGSLHGPVKEALKLLNKTGEKKYAALVFGDVWPLPEKLLLEKAGKAKAVINIEQNATGQLASLIRECTGIKCDGSILKYDGRPICAEFIIENIKLILTQKQLFLEQDE